MTAEAAAQKSGLILCCSSLFMTTKKSQGIFFVVYMIGKGECL